jgi:hypothetical protein
MLELALYHIYKITPLGRFNIKIKLRGKAELKGQRSKKPDERRIRRLLYLGETEHEFSGIAVL